MAVSSPYVTLGCACYTDLYVEGQATDSQIFSFAGQKTLPLALKNDATTCLAPTGGKLNSAGCSGAAGQDFTIG